MSCFLVPFASHPRRPFSRDSVVVVSAMKNLALLLFVSSPSHVDAWALPETALDGSDDVTELMTPYDPFRRLQSGGCNANSLPCGASCDCSGGPCAPTCNYAGAQTVCNVADNPQASNCNAPDECCNGMTSCSCGASDHSCDQGTYPSDQACDFDSCTPKTRCCSLSWPLQL